MDNDTFEWKSDGKIFMGVGIYHLTFVVSGRRPLLGEVVGASAVGMSAGNQSMDICAMANDGGSVEEKARMAWVKLTPYGKAVDDMLRHYDEAHEGIAVCQRIVMDDHLHVVLWVKKPQYSTVQHRPQSILQIAYGMRIQFTHMAQDMGVWPKGVRVEGALHAEKGAGHTFEKQFVRTLSRKGQLRSMIDYVALNPYRKFMVRQNPELFTLHKDTEVKGLHFRSMGNHWMLDWPERQVVECSRDISEEDLQCLMKQVMQRAEVGAITYTAAMSKGEQRIARAVREAGCPLVVLLLEGFPPAGSDSERYYKPGGVYFEICKNGKLLLLEANESSYANDELIQRTEATLTRKAEEKHYCYRPLPHTSTRWRMIAGNEMLGMIAGE